MPTRPLPRSLDPPPAESLQGYILRLAHRLDLPPLRVAALTGLSTPGKQNSLPASHMFALDVTTADTFARATRLSAGEVAALSLARLGDRYPFLDPAFCGRQRTLSGMLVKENWVLFRASRYCPDCLAGDHSTIQQQHGGAWNLLWRLPIVFACSTHRRLLKHSCPTCEQPVHHRGSQHMLAAAGRSGLHPAQCRASLTDSATGIRTGVCGARLDTTKKAVPQPAQPLIELQEGLLNHLQPDNLSEVISTGQATTSQQYLVDLRILCCLITASWPQARNLADGQARARLDSRVRATQRRITSVRETGRTVRELSVYDSPPPDVAACADLLATADRLLVTNDVDGLRRALHLLLADAPRGTQLWLRQFLAGDGYCSSGLQTALGLELAIPRIRTQLGLPPAEPTPAPSRLNTLRFGPEHVPQHLLLDWYTEHLERFANHVKPRLLRRACAARLAHLCVGGSPVQAARYLGIPRLAAKNALAVVRHQLAPRRRHEFDAAVDALADHLNTVESLVNYGNRCGALAEWSLSTSDWASMTSGLRQRPEYARAGRWPNSPYVDWANEKRILASTWVWVRITSGEHLSRHQSAPTLTNRETEDGSTAPISAAGHSSAPTSPKATGQNSETTSTTTPMTSQNSLTATIPTRLSPSRCSATMT